MGVVIAADSGSAYPDLEAERADSSNATCGVV